MPFTVSNVVVQLRDYQITLFSESKAAAILVLRFQASDHLGARIQHTEGSKKLLA